MEASSGIEIGTSAGWNSSPESLTKVEGDRHFEPAFDDFQRRYFGSTGRLPPTFAFINPFGWTGAPFSIVRYILGQPKWEVLVTFMYEINRLHRSSRPDGKLRLVLRVRGLARRHRVGRDGQEKSLHDLYLRQLKNAAGAKYVRSFPMCNMSGVTDYYLFYATGSLTGLKKMKEAMWAVDPSGELTFSDATNPRQLVLFSGTPRYGDLRRQILTRLANCVATVGEIEEFVLAETAFCHTHDKKQVLKPLEISDSSPSVVLDEPPRRPCGTFASPNPRLRFRWQYGRRLVGSTKLQ
jgi:hypothetical protein